MSIFIEPAQIPQNYFVNNTDGVPGAGKAYI